MAIEKELLDHLFANYNYQKPEDLIGENRLLKQLTKAILEQALQAEMTVHLGHDKHGAIAIKSGNARNGKTSKFVLRFVPLFLKIKYFRNGIDKFFFVNTPISCKEF